MVALLQILENPVYRDAVQPETYSKAAGEVIFLVILVCGLLTLIFNPEQYESNDVKTVLGYNSPCVVWDSAPATWVGAPMWSFVVYLNMRYCVLMAQRALVMDHLPTWKRRLCVMADIAYVFSTAIVPIVFVISPSPEHWRKHFAGFVQLIPMRFFAVASSYVQFPELVTKSSLVFLLVYGILTFVEFGGAFATMVFYESGDPLIHPILMQSVDYLWFLSLPLAARFAPKTPPLDLRMSVHEEGDPVQGDVIGLVKP